MEKLVLGRLEAAVPSLCPMQFGFRANHSVHTAVATLSNHIQHTMGTKTKQVSTSRDRHHATAAYVHKGALLSLDVAGAVDKVNPYLLCSKLLDAGIDPRLVKLISSFLLDKRHSVRVGGTSTRLARIPLGLPQGSALAPWLYSFFTAGALNALSNLKNTTALAYADDLTLYMHAPTTDAVEQLAHEAFTEAQKLFSDIMLPLNPNKSSILLFTTDVAEQGRLLSVWDHRAGDHRREHLNNDTVEELLTNVQTRGRRLLFTDPGTP
eukprot:5034635-Amphidinium_carterae.1